MVFISKVLASAMATIPSVTQIGNQVIRILGCNPGHMTLQGTNTYLVGTGPNRILIDAGDKNVPQYEANLAQVLVAKNVKIEHIILTHWHHDHIGGVENLLESIARNAKVWKHRKSPEDNPDNDLPLSVPMNWLSDGQVIKVEGAAVTIHHTPGHTTDHVCVMIPEEKILFSGDCILGEGSAIFEDLYSYMKSLKKINDLQPKVIYPGHGNIVMNPSDKIQEYMLHRQLREVQILAALQMNASKKMNEMEIVQMIYTSTPEELWPAAAYNVHHHLTKLTKENKVKVVNVDGKDKWQYNSGSESDSRL